MRPANNRRLQPLRYLHDCSDCFRLERLPGGIFTHWKAPPLHGARQKRTRYLSFYLCQRLRDFARTIDEKLRDWAERAILQGDNSVWHAGYRYFNGQDPKLRSPRGKSQRRNRKYREK